jgi:hypothetical protein
MDMIEILNSKLAQQHSDALQRKAEAARIRHSGEPLAATPETGLKTRALVIRAVRPTDGPALRRLSQLDGQAHLDPRSALVAEVDGELLAALPLDGRDAIANPFESTAELVEMLKLRAAQLRGEATEGGRLKRFWSTHWRVTSRPAMAPLAGDVSVLPVRHDGE